MTAVYNSLAKAAPPITLSEVRSYLKITSTADDSLLNILIEAVTTYGENYTGREYRANTYEVLLDCFEPRIKLFKTPIASITSIKYTVLGALVAVSPSIYYLKHGTFTNEILLVDGQSWPTDGDVVEQGIVIALTAKAAENIEQFKMALYRHIAYMYKNRGDCDDVSEAAKLSGACGIYGTLRIPRV